MREKGIKLKIMSKNKHMKKLLIVLTVLLNNFVFAQIYSPTFFSKNDFKQDIKFLREKITNIHPKCLDEAFNKKWEKQYNLSLYDLGDSLTFNECYIRFAPLMSILEDGHSNFSFPYTERLKYMKSNGVTMPLTVKVRNNTIYIDKYFGETDYYNIKGAEIISINNIKSENILKKLQIFYGAKNINITNHNIERYFSAYFWTVFGEFSYYNLEIKKNNKQSLISIPPVTNSKYFKLRNKLFPKQIEEKYKLSFYKNNNFAYLKIKSFADKIKLSTFLSAAFDTIIDMGSKNLVIDVRDNLGGTSDCVDTLLSYLTDKQYKQYSSIGLRICDDIKEKYKNKKPKLYEKIKDLNNDKLFYFNDSMLIKTPVLRKNIFHGNIFILINNMTYSAASTFAGVIREYEIGKIVGQTPTGGTIEYYGDFLLFKLPNTKMNFFVSPKIFRQYGGNVLNKGVLPDIMIQESEDLDIPMIIESLITNANNTHKNK